MRVFVCGLACGLAVLVLAGCSGKTVSVVDEAGFRSMANRCSQAFKAQEILDGDGAYLEPMMAVSGAPDDAGERLFRNLSPSFRFRDEDTALLPPTFAASRAEGDELSLRPHGFILVQGMRRVSVSLLGLADWNGDGTADWFVRCSVRALQRAAGEDERDYYLVITDPGAQVIRAQVVGVYDCHNRRCVNYTARDYPRESCVVESLAGQRAVTAPPSKSGGTRVPDSLQERALKN